MQRWWLGVAGVVGVALAMVLTQRPDTGADVPDVSIEVSVPELPPIREHEDVPLRRMTAGTNGPTTGTPVPAPSFVPSTTAPVPKSEINPAAARLAERRDTAEARYAAKAMGPWTQVRRLLAIKNADESSVQQAEEMVDELREMFRDPTMVDAEAVEKRQTELIAEVRQNPAHDEELEKMLVLIEDRMVDYREDRDGSR